MARFASAPEPTVSGRDLAELLRHVTARSAIEAAARSLDLREDALTQSDCMLILAELADRGDALGVVANYGRTRVPGLFLELKPSSQTRLRATEPRRSRSRFRTTRETPREGPSITYVSLVGLFATGSPLEEASRVVRQAARAVGVGQETSFGPDHVDQILTHIASLGGRWETEAILVRIRLSG